MSIYFTFNRIKIQSFLYSGNYTFLCSYHPLQITSFLYYPINFTFKIIGNLEWNLNNPKYWFDIFFFLYFWTFWGWFEIYWVPFQSNFTLKIDSRLAGSLIYGWMITRSAFKVMFDSFDRFTFYYPINFWCHSAVWRYWFLYKMIILIRSLLVWVPFIL